MALQGLHGLALLVEEIRDCIVYVAGRDDVAWSRRAHFVGDEGLRIR
jgi:hypothetical protein